MSKTLVGYLMSKDGKMSRQRVYVPSDGGFGVNAKRNEKDVEKN